MMAHYRTLPAVPLANKALFHASYPHSFQERHDGAEGDISDCRRRRALSAFDCGRHTTRE